MDLHLPTGEVAGFCFTLPEVCEGKRQFAFAEPDKYGTPGECETRRTAYCFRWANPYSLSRRSMCMGTLESCEESRREAIEHVSSSSVVSECEPALNTDGFQSATEPGWPVEASP